MSKILYKAKHLYSEKHIVSDSIQTLDNGCDVYLYSREDNNWIECDKNTLSINFEDMVDSEGTKIFASLSEEYESTFISCELKAKKISEMGMSFDKKAVYFSGLLGAYIINFESVPIFGSLPQRFKVHTHRLSLNVLSDIEVVG